MKKYRMKAGSTVVALKPLRPWAPLRFGTIPKGAHGKVSSVYMAEEPTLGGPDIELAFANINFKWIDGKGKSRSSRWTVPVDSPKLRVVEYMPSSESKRDKGETAPPVSRRVGLGRGKPLRITPKRPKLRR